MANYLREISGDPQFDGSSSARSSYVQCRKNGCSVNMAKMLALQQPPTDKSDRRFLCDLSPRKQGNKQELARELKYRKQAERAGISHTGSVYLSALADKRQGADPGAWISSRSDLQRVAQERRLKISGAVECDYTDQTVMEMPDIGVSPKLVEEEVRKIESRSAEPLTPKKRNMLREQVFEKRKGSKSKAKFQATERE